MLGYPKPPSNNGMFDQRESEGFCHVYIHDIVLFS